MRISKGDQLWMKYGIPKEHGAWAIWVLPFFIGAIASRSLGVNTFLVFGSCLLVFAARSALASAVRLRRRKDTVAFKCAAAGAIEVIAAAVLAAPLLLGGNYALALTGLIAAALLAVDLIWIKERTERSIVAELAGVAGFALAAPAAFVASAGAWRSEAMILWGVCFAYFAGSVFYVKLRVARMTPDSEKNRGAESLYSRMTVGYVIFVATITVLVSYLTEVAFWLIAAFLPWLIYLMWGAVNSSPQRSLHRVGWTLVAHSLYFTTLVAVTFSGT